MIAIGPPKAGGTLLNWTRSFRLVHPSPAVVTSGTPPITRPCLVRMVYLPRRVPDPSPPHDRIVLVKGRAGLGNRILSLLSAALFARLTRRRLIADWSDITYSSDGTNSIHHFFTSPLFSPVDEIPSTDSVSPSLWRGRLHDSILTVSSELLPRTFRDPVSWRVTSADLSRLDHPEQVLVMWSFFSLIREIRRHFHGEFSEFRVMDDEAILSRLLSECLHLHPSIAGRVADIRSSWPSRPVVGVHVRLTDKQVSLGAVHSRLRRLLDSNPGLSVFLCTDNREVQEAFRLTYPDLLTTPKWFPVQARARMHESPECPDKRANGVEALIDLYLLASCDHLIVDKSSSFAHVAVLLSGLAPDRIHDLQRWRLLTPGQRHILWFIATTLKWAPRRIMARWDKAPAAEMPTTARGDHPPDR